MSKYKEIRDVLKTGDIVLFSGQGGISTAIKVFSKSKWSHIGIVVKSKELNTVFLLESTTLNNVTDVETQSYKKGVQIVDLSTRVEKFDGSISVKLLNKELSEDQLKIINLFREEIKNRPYERSEAELIKSLVDIGKFTENEKDLSSIFCSELVAEALMRVSVIKSDLPSNEYIPKDFSDGGFFETKMINNFSYSKEIKIK